MIKRTIYEVDIENLIVPNTSTSFRFVDESQRQGFINYMENRGYKSKTRDVEANVLFEDWTEAVKAADARLRENGLKKLTAAEKEALSLGKVEG